MIQDLNKEQPYTISYSDDYAREQWFEPGNLITPIIYAIALQNGSIEPSTLINCHNGLYRDGLIRVSDYRPFRTLKASEVIKKSSNIGIYKIALKCGKNHIINGIHKFFPNAITPSDQHDINFSRLTYGYAIAVTHEDILKAYCEIASEKKSPLFISKGVKIKTRRAMLTAVETGGTAHRIKTSDIAIAATTGTSFTFDPLEKRYNRNFHNAGCVAIFPASFPRYVILLIVKAKHSKTMPAFGGTVAAPQIKKIAEILRDFE